MSDHASESRQWIARLREAAGALSRPVAFMEVCGTHTVNAFRAGLHSLTPENVRLLSGPGCPVCVTSQGDIDLMISLGERDDLTICTYGDMLRVTGSNGMSLQQARSNGAQVRTIYSAMDAVKLAAAEPNRQVVFAAVGFETTTPATAAAILAARARGLTNFTVLASHKRIIPAMRALLDDGRAKVDGFLCPGHVCVIVGSEVFREIVERYGLPCVIAGFEDVQIAAGLARLTELARDGKKVLENQYPQAVGDGGNPTAMRLIDEVFEPADVAWRALGTLPESGLAIREKFNELDASVRFGLIACESPEPPGCRCGEVITGRCTPGDCGLFGKLCTPVNPIGPCMVSSEGTCQAWFKYHRHESHKSAAGKRVQNASLSASVSEVLL